MNVFRQILESVASIRKCVPHTTLTQIMLPDHAFSCPRSVFDEAVKGISNQMSMDEQQTARAIEEMIANLNMQNIGILIPTLNSLRGAIQRPRIKKYLQQGDQKIQQVMDRVLNEIDDSILLVSQFCQQIEQKSGDEIISQIV